jgi:hypothetical protein
LDFEGVYGDTTLRDDETEEAPCGDAKNTLERVQVDVVLTTSLKYDL